MVFQNPTKIRYWTSVARTIMTGPAEILWKMITPINDDNIVTPDPLSLNYNISWSCFQGTLSKVNRINQVTKTPNSYVVLSAIAGSLHVMMKVIGLQQLGNMNVLQYFQLNILIYYLTLIIFFFYRLFTLCKQGTLITRHRFSFVYQ